MFKIIKGFIIVVISIFLIIGIVIFGMGYFLTQSNTKLKKLATNLDKEKFLSSITENNTISLTANITPIINIPATMNVEISPNIISTLPIKLVTKEISQKNLKFVLFRDPFEYKTAVDTLPAVEKSTKNIVYSFSIKPKTTLKQFNVQGYMQYKDRYQAIINGKIYEEGDKINEWLIKSISTEKITLIKDGKFKVITY